MLATSIDLPPAWYPAIVQIQGLSNSKPYPPALYSQQYGNGYVAGNSLSMAKHLIPRNSIASLGWTPIEALETHLRLRIFEDDWDYPGMEAYDDL